MVSRVSLLFLVLGSAETVVLEGRTNREGHGASLAKKKFNHCWILVVLVWDPG